MKIRYIGIIIVITLLVLCFGCSGNGDSEAQNGKVVPVETTVVTRGNVVQSLTFMGDVKAEQSVSIYSKVPDRIETFYVEMGDKVRKGDPIARIAAMTIEQNVRQAEAALISAKAQEANMKIEFERAERLSKEQAMSLQQFESIRTQYESIQATEEQAQAALSASKSQLDDALITSPIDGVIGKRYLEAGDMASPGMPLVSIVKMENVKITFNATEKDLIKLQIGQKATVTISALVDEKFEGNVFKISPVLDPVTRMAEIEVLVNNEKRLLRPGMYARVEVITGIIENIIMIPRFATIESTSLQKIGQTDQVVKNYYVFIVDSNQPVQKKLNVIYVNHEWLAVRDGINVGDQLITAGQNNIRDGMTVSVVQNERENS